MAYYGSGPAWQPPPPGGWQNPPPGSGWQYQPPVNVAASDGAYRWFKVYVAVMAAVYLLAMLGGAFFFVVDLGGTPEEVTEQRLMGAIYAAFGLGLLVLYGIGLFMPKRPWAWIYGIVLIAIGMTSCCTLPATIPLLIFWLKPEMKARFGRS
jgi:hypothetical protein